MTYRPLAQIVGLLGGREGVEALLGDGPAAQTVLTAAGLSQGQAQAEKTFWAVRRLLETAAAERPLVVVLEDLHTAEPTLRDLVEDPTGRRACSGARRARSRWPRSCASRRAASRCDWDYPR